VVNAVVKGVARARVNSMDPRRWPCSSDAAPFSAAAGAGRLEELARPWRGKARDARCSRVCASLSPEDFLVGRIHTSCGQGAHPHEPQDPDRTRKTMEHSVRLKGAQAGIRFWV
jgi:hypothetical protein